MTDIWEKWKHSLIFCGHFVKLPLLHGFFWLCLVKSCLIRIKNHYMWDAMIQKPFNFEKYFWKILESHKHNKYSNSNKSGHFLCLRELKDNTLTYSDVILSLFSICWCFSSLMLSLFLSKGALKKQPQCDSLQLLFILLMAERITKSMCWKMPLSCTNRALKLFKLNDMMCHHCVAFFCLLLRCKVFCLFS